VGSLPRLIRQRFDFLEAARQRYGDIFTLGLGPSQGIALCHPRHAQHVLVDHAGNYSKGGPFWDSLRTVMGNGLPVSDGDYWKRQRRMLQPAFHRERLAAITDTMRETIDESLTSLWEPAARSGQPFDVAGAFTHMTMNVLVRTMFGTGLATPEVERGASAMMYIIDFMLREMVTQVVPAWVPLPGRSRYREAIRTVDALVQQVLERGDEGAAHEDSILSLLRHATDAETGERMTPRQIRDETVALFVAGYETTTVTMSWVFHYLTQQPELAERLRAEVDDVLGARPPGFGDLPRLSLARGVVQEAMRLYPPAYWLPRQAVEDDEIDGYRIPAGTLVGVLTYLIHRRPDLWEAPERFDPERFSPERSAGRHRYAWLPFSAGQRQCIGKEFSLMEALLILCRVMQRFSAAAVPGRVAQVHFGTTLSARNGVWVRLAAREGRAA
jgi:cytochrome P450